MSSMITDVDTALEQYQAFLLYQPLSNKTRATYLTQVRQFCTYLKQGVFEYGHPLKEDHARDYAVRDYKTQLKIVHRRKPSTINLMLAAVDHFYRFLQMDQAAVRRETLPKQAPRALEPEEQKRFLRAVERCKSVRNRAIAMLLLYTGLRVSECSQLDLQDVVLSARKGMVIVRDGKGGAYREIPLNSEVREILRAWLRERHAKFQGTTDTAFFLNRQGQRLLPRPIDLLLRQIARDAHLTLSAHVLRHTCLTNLVRNGNDLILVAEIAGHQRLETTRRYTLPSETNRLQAMEDLKIEY